MFQSIKYATCNLALTVYFSILPSALSHAQPVSASLERIDSSNQSISVFEQRAQVPEDGIDDIDSDQWSFNDPVSTVFGKIVSVMNSNGTAQQETALEATVNAAQGQTVFVGTANTVAQCTGSVFSEQQGSLSQCQWASEDAQATFQVEKPAFANGSGYLSCQIHIVATLNDNTDGESGDFKTAAGFVEVGNSRIDYVLQPNGLWHVFGSVGEGGRLVTINKFVGAVNEHHTFTHAIVGGSPVVDGTSVEVESSFGATFAIGGPTGVTFGEDLQIDQSGLGSVAAYFNIQ